MDGKLDLKIAGPQIVEAHEFYTGGDEHLIERLGLAVHGGKRGIWRQAVRGYQKEPLTPDITRVAAAGIGVENMQGGDGELGKIPQRSIQSSPFGRTAVDAGKLILADPYQSRHFPSNELSFAWVSFGVQVTS
jgi:hypothetical protein